MTLRVYYRVSTEKQDFEMQYEALLNLCKSSGFNYNHCKVYQDFGLSGTTTNRPEYQRLLSEVEENDLILVYEFSRLWRDIGEQSRVTKMLKSLNVTVLSYRDGQIDNNSEMLLVNIKGCFNEYEAERLRKRTKDGIAAKKAKIAEGLDIWNGRGPDKKKRNTEGYKKEQERRRQLKKAIL